jgi:hypothetical protein
LLSEEWDDVYEGGNFRATLTEFLKADSNFDVD